jgi:hypothetical protein
MRLFWRILGIGAVLALIYILFVGLGLTHLFKTHKQLKKILVLNDFEYSESDLDWTTGGYVTIESSTENQTHGKHSLKASYLLPSQFMTMPTATPVPAVMAPTAPAAPKAKTKSKGKGPRPTPTEAPVDTPAPTAKPATWLPAMVLSTDSVTQMPLVDWTGFTTLNVDAFNPQDHPVTYHLEVADGRAFQYQTSGELAPKKVTNVSIPLDDIAQARLDLSAIRSLSLSVDVRGNTVPVQVYWDYLRLEEVLAPAPKK